MTAATFQPTRSVVLVGLMGAGKTTVGERLAARLALPFSDSDAEVERSAGLSVAEIFEQRGEPAFRELEREAIGRLIRGSPRVIAAGGGAFVDEDTRGLMLKRCIVVWLDADVQTLAGRLAGESDRPLLRDGDPESMLARLRSDRERYYAQAPIRIDARPAVQTVVEQIIAALIAHG